MLEIRDLHARIADTETEIIRGLNLTVKAGEVAAIMGPNGSGKSTLSYILSGREDYEVTSGDILYNGESILELDAAERAAKGVFLAFQYPVEIPGVATMQFLKVAMNEQRMQHLGASARKQRADRLDQRLGWRLVDVEIDAWRGQIEASTTVVVAHALALEEFLGAGRDRLRRNH